MQKEGIAFHAQNYTDVLNNLESSQNGLTKEKANAKRLQYGENTIPEKKSRSNVVVFFSQFNSVMVYILLIAAAISFLLHKMLDVYVILVVIFLNVIIGFAQEYRAERAIQALKRMIVPQARVIRNAELIQIPARDLVPGDIIILEEGDRVPADARLMQVKDFRTVESSLTGESLPVDKYVKLLAEKTPLSDQKNMVWLGTFVASGKAQAIVVATGRHTAIGKLASSLQSIQHTRSHFQEKTDILAKHIALISLVGAFIIFLIGYYLRNLPLSDMFLFAIAALVAAIPEGLPTVLAIVLAVGARRIAKKKAIVRDRYSPETLGIVDTIVTDKTGTITENTMTVEQIFLPGQGTILVDGAGWIPRGNFTFENQLIVPLENKQLNKLLHMCAICNDAKIYKEVDEKNTETYKIVGDPTEAALIVLAEKAGLTTQVLQKQEKRIDDMPFNPSLKYHASLSVLTDKAGKREMYVIGAPEAILKNARYILKNGRKCPFTKKEQEQFEKQIDAITNQAMRALAAAYKEVSSKTQEIHEQDATDLVIIGVVGMQDPPREGVKEAIQKAQKAGIRVIMATGDHKNTAIAVAREVGLITKSESALTGEELALLSDSEFERAINKVSVFARLSPEIKLRIAQTLQRQGRVVAMTGDGVNDAPALKQADVGIAMGKIGTDVAREASNIILTDDNFISIIDAIEEGRTVFVNTRQTSFYLVATGFASYLTIVATLLIGLPLPLLPIQVLWLNLVTGALTDVSLATEKSHHDVLEEKPRSKHENLLNKEILPFLVMTSVIMLTLTLLVFNYYLPNLEKARTAAFAAMCFTQLFSIFTMRSLKYSVFKIGIFSNKYVTGAFFISVLALLLAVYLPFTQYIFDFKPLSYFEMGIICALASSTLWFGELYKKIRDRKNQILVT